MSGTLLLTTYTSSQQCKLAEAKQSYYLAGIPLSYKLCFVFKNLPKFKYS